MKPLLVLLGLLLSGCGPTSCVAARAKETVKAHVPSLPDKGASLAMPKLDDDKDSTVEERKVHTSNSKVADLEGQLAEAREENRQDKKALQDSRYNTLRKLSLWMAAIAFLCTCGAVVAAILLPLFRLRFIMGAVACLSVMVLSLTVDTIIEYIPWIGSGILFAGMAALIWWLVKSRQAITFAAAAGDMLATVNPLNKDSMDQIKDLIHYNQTKAGVVKLIQEARGKPVKPLKEEA